MPTKEDAEEASGIPIFYGIIEIAVIPVFAMVAWRMGWTYAPPETNVCIAMAGNFQPSDEPEEVELTEEEKQQIKSML